MTTPDTSKFTTIAPPAGNEIEIDVVFDDPAPEEIEIDVDVEMGEPAQAAPPQKSKFAGGFLSKLTSRFSKPAVPPDLKADTASRPILDIVARAEGGPALLALAEQKGYTISVNPDLKVEALHESDSRNRVIELRPNEPEKMAVALAHELKHAEQYDIIEMSSRTRARMSPLANIVMSRILEGDAHAFEEVFTRNVERTGDPNLRRLSPAEVKEAYDNYQSSVVSHRYDQRAAEYAMAGEKSFGLKDLTEQFDIRKLMKTQDGKDYSGGMSNKEIIESALQKVDPQLVSALRNEEPRAVAPAAKQSAAPKV